jgi:phosphate acetyltransferase
LQLSSISGERLDEAPPPATNPFDLVMSKCNIFSPENKFSLIGVIPWEDKLLSPRTYDMAIHLGAEIVNEGDIMHRRVDCVKVVARSVRHMVSTLKANTLIITPADRDDIILAVCMAATNGVPLAGLVLTGGYEADSGVLELCSKAFHTGLPVLMLETDSYITAANAANIDPQVAIEDSERIKNVMNYSAERLKISETLLPCCTLTRQPRMSPAAFMYLLETLAKEHMRRIVLPEGLDPRIVKAAVTCHQRKIARCTLLGDPCEVHRIAAAQDLTLPEDMEILNPNMELRLKYVDAMVELRKHKGLSKPMAMAQLEDVAVLGTMMLAVGDVDGLVSGACHSTANTVRPALQLIKTRADAKLISSIFFMLLPNQVAIYGDCAINPDPNAAELADIALQSAASAEAFGIEARVAMLSYSTGTSGKGCDVDKVREATRIAQECRPDLLIDGPLQFDAACTEDVAAKKAPNSKVAGKATVLIFPDLNTGNTTYKAVQRTANVVAVGPMLQGLRRPVNDLSRGCLVDDIVYTIALTAIQANQAEEVIKSPVPTIRKQLVIEQSAEDVGR